MIHNEIDYYTDYKIIFDEFYKMKVKYNARLTNDELKLVINAIFNPSSTSYIVF